MFIARLFSDISAEIGVGERYRDSIPLTRPVFFYFLSVIGHDGFFRTILSGVRNLAPIAVDILRIIFQFKHHIIVCVQKLILIHNKSCSVGSQRIVCDRPGIGSRRQIHIR